MTLFLWYLNWAYLPVTLAIAIIWGARDERIAVGIIVLALLGTHFATSEMATRYHSVEIGVLEVDTLMCVALIALAIRSDRFWPLWATSFHLLSIYTHLGMMFATDIVAFPYAFLAGWWAWPTQASLVIGVFEYRRRMRRQKLSG